MRLFTRVPLAWRNLVHDWWRFALSVAGIALAVTLKLVQLGFWGALLGGQVRVLRALRGELTLISTAKTSLTDGITFPSRKLQQVRSVPGVVAAHPLYIRSGAYVWKNRWPEPPNAASDSWTRFIPFWSSPEQHIGWPIRIIAFEPSDDHPIFKDLPGLKANYHKLLAPNTALIDSRSKSKFYDILAQNLLGEQETVAREVGGHLIQVVGTYTLGTDFTADGSLLMTTNNLARISPFPTPLGSVDVGVIQLEENADARAVKRQLQNILVNDEVEVLTMDELVWKEMWFWQTNTPIGIIFGMGLVVGFVVGMVICYQILASDVTDHLTEYATLKAIGYEDGSLNGVVLFQSVVLGGMGFLFGVLVSLPLYNLLSNWTGLPLQLTLVQAVCVLATTILMCVLSGFLALQKVRNADPAEVFG